MAKKSHDSYDLVLYSIGLALTFLVFLLSRWLSGSVMKEIESGTSLVDLVFDGSDQISFLWNLLLPTLLLFTGISILLVLLWQMVKSIVTRHDSKFNKLLLILIVHVIVIDLLFAFKNGWQLLLLNFQYIIITGILLFLFASTVRYFVKVKKN
ncbi:hypothetical protein ACOQFO_02450 [Ureibacillus sp. MALMAid1270]|uniref:hypothetical protein n=1 Tax=Ureibacillus sp. MALMAid1270 TaxID=3411629 RepID=UPI003BA5D951